MHLADPRCVWAWGPGRPSPFGNALDSMASRVQHRVLTVAVPSRQDGSYIKATSRFGSPSERGVRRKVSGARVSQLSDIVAADRQHRILVVDDEPAIVRLLEINLRVEGFEVEGAHRGDEALMKARRHPPDLILLDIMMPGLDGLEVRRRLKQDPDLSSIPVIVVSDRAEELEREHGSELGVVTYVAKPFDLGGLVSLVRSTLARARPSG